MPQPLARTGYTSILPLFLSLSQVIKRNESVMSKTANPPSAAIVAVYLDKAEALPVSYSLTSFPTALFVQCVGLRVCVYLTIV